jgi:hypothetical protein
MKRMLFLSVGLMAAMLAKADGQTLFESLATPDSLTEAVALVYQDSLMQQALERQHEGNNTEVSRRGFRVQLFSSNNVRTARNAAFQVEKTVREKLPHLAVYVTYTSPFWKVRVGNCATNDDAQRLRQYIIEQLPQFQAETYVVPDQIQPNQ